MTHVFALTGKNESKSDIEKNLIKKFHHSDHSAHLLISLNREGAKTLSSFKFSAAGYNKLSS